MEYTKKKGKTVKIIKAGVIFICIAMPLIFSSLALAIDNPDSDPSVSNVRANTYLIEEGDVLIYGDYNLPYASPPDDPASNAFIFRLLDTDGETELGAISPFVLFDNGYNEGVFGFYFSASDNLTWGEAYTIRISQNPALFTTPTSVDYLISLSVYSSKTTQDDNQVELTINIIAMAERLESAHTDYTLLESSVGGTVLSDPTGETYFRGAIYGLQAMAPSLFLIQILEFDRADREWTTDQFDEYEERFDDTWVGDGVDATATQFGITPQMLMGVLFVLPLCIGGIILSSMKYGKAEPGFIISAIFLTLGALMGWLPAAIFATLYQAMAIYLAYLWFYARG